MTDLQARNSKSSEPSAQMIEGEVIFKEEHKVIYDAFVQLLEREEQSEELNKDDKAVLAFMLGQNRAIFKNVKPEDIKPLSEENFLQFLLPVFEKIREKKLANKENLENGKIKEVVDDCVADIRSTEARDSSIKFVLEALLLIGGVKIDPKNISGSFMSGLKEKIPFLGGNKEENEPPLSDEEMVTTFLRKVFLPTLFSIASILVFGPTTLAIVAAAVGAALAVKGGLEVLFSSNKKGTLYNPNTEKEEGKEWGKEISSGISKILDSKVNGIDKSEQPQLSGEGAEKRPVPEQIATRGSYKKKEDERRQQKKGQHGVHN